MGCTYNFNGEEFQSKNDLVDYISKNPDSLPDNLMLELFPTESEFSIMPESQAKLFKDSNYMAISNDALLTIGGENITFEYVKGLVENERREKLKKIAPKLNDFANKLGVSVEFINQDGVDGVARIADGIIGISMGVSDMSDSYYEEMSHMLRERFNERISNEALDEFIPSTKEYAKYSNEYRQVYQSEGLSGEELERKVNLEIYDKILAGELRRALTSSPIAEENQGGLWETIRQLISEFIDWVRGVGNTEAQNIMREIVRAVGANDFSRFSNTSFDFQNYYRLQNKDPELQSLSNDIIAAYKNTLAAIRATKGSDAVVNIVERDIYGLGDGDGVSVVNMLSSYLSTASRIKSELEREIALMASTETFISSDDLAMANFLIYIDEILPAIKKSAVNGKFMGIKSEKEKQMVGKKIDELAANIKYIKEQYDKHAEDISTKRLEEGLRLMNTSDDQIEKIKNNMKSGVAEDTSWWQKNLFSGYASSSTIETLFHKLRSYMVDSINQRMRNYEAKFKDKLAKLGVGFDQFNTLIDVGSDGKATGYVISPYMRDVIDKAFFDKVMAEVDKDILDENTISMLIENKMQKQELTDEQLEMYEYATSKARTEMTEKPFLDEYYLEREAEMKANIRAKFPNKTDAEVQALYKAIARKTTPLYSKKANIIARITEKGGNTRDEILNISVGDKAELDAIDAQIRSLSQRYNSLTSLKQGEELEIAEVLTYSLENYVAKEDDTQLTREYHEYLSQKSKDGQDIYQIMSKTASIVFNEDDSMDEAMYEMGVYEIYANNPIIQKINAYLPEGEKLIIRTPNEVNGVKQKLNPRENADIKKALSTLKEISKALKSPHRKFGELRIGNGGLSGTELTEVIKIQEIFSAAKKAQVLSEEEKAKIKSDDIAFIPTNNFYNDYGYININDAEEVKSSQLKLDGTRKLIYVLQVKDGNPIYFYKDPETGEAVRTFPSEMELERKQNFERTHMETNSTTKELEPKFYYKKIVKEKKIEYFDKPNPLLAVLEPTEGVIYISKINGRQYKYDAQLKNFVEVPPLDINKGERYIQFGGKTFLVQVKPNALWKGKAQSEKYINPNYNKELGDKVVQYKDVIDVNGKKVSTLNDKYFNKFGISKFNKWGEATREKNLYDAMKLMLDENQRLTRATGLRLDYYFRPQVRITPDEILYTKGGIENVFKSAKAWIKRNIVANEQDVDELSAIGKVNFSLKAGKQRNQLPHNFHIKIPQEELTNNLLGSYITMADMAIKYDERAKHLMEANMLMNVAKEVEFAIDERNTEKGRDSNVYKAMLDNYLSDFFGSLNIELGTLNILGKPISMTKVLRTSKNIATGNALGFNKYVAITSAIAGWVNKQKEMFVGRYGTKEDYTFANETINKMDMVRDLGNSITGEKILRIAEFMGIVDPQDAMKRASRDKSINRLATIADPFSFIRLGDMLRVSESAIIGLLQFRKIDGKWYSRDTFLDEQVNNNKVSMKDANEIWNANQRNALFHEILKGYNAEDKTLEIPENLRELFKNASYIGKKHHSDLTGGVKDIDSANILRHPIFAPLGMFKNYFINALQNRFQSETTDQYTGGVRKGSYRYVEFNLEYAKTLAMVIMGLDNKINSPDSGLTYQEIQALRRIQVDTYIALVFLAIAMMAKAIGDDDEYEDVWAVQAAAYSATKTFGEVIGGDIYAIPFTAYESVTKPYGVYERLTKGADGLIFGGEDVSRGNYKGMDKRVASAIKLSPMGISNIYNLVGDDAASARRYWYKDRWIFDMFKQLEEE